MYFFILIFLFRLVTLIKLREKEDKEDLCICTYKWTGSAQSTLNKQRARDHRNGPFRPFWTIPYTCNNIHLEENFTIPSKCVCVWVAHLSEGLTYGWKWTVSFQKMPNWTTGGKIFMRGPFARPMNEPNPTMSISITTENPDWHFLIDIIWFHPRSCHHHHHWFIKWQWITHHSTTPSPLSTVVYSRSDISILQ